MNENKKWFAVHTRPGWEKKVTEILSRKKIESYCPLNKVMRPFSDHKKITYEPLFGSCVFAKISENEIQHLEQTDGVISLVYWLGRPAVISTSEIEIIKSFLNEYAAVRLEKIGINVNPTVRISESPFARNESDLPDLKNGTVKTMLPSLGYLMLAGT